jgi:hypothetical protein
MDYDHHVTDRVIGCAIEVHRALGLLLNFNRPKLVDGIKRIVL